jgi:hypothetical protein
MLRKPGLGDSRMLSQETIARPIPSGALVPGASIVVPAAIIAAGERAARRSRVSWGTQTINQTGGRGAAVGEDATHRAQHAACAWLLDKCIRGATVRWLRPVRGSDPFVLAGGLTQHA